MAGTTSDGDGAGAACMPGGGVSECGGSDMTRTFGLDGRDVVSQPGKANFSGAARSLARAASCTGCDARAAMRGVAAWARDAPFRSAAAVWTGTGRCAGTAARAGAALRTLTGAVGPIIGAAASAGAASSSVVLDDSAAGWAGEGAGDAAAGVAGAGMLAGCAAMSRGLVAADGVDDA
jgi:hypothetical protein